MKQIRKYRDFYNNIKYRTNVFEWYPFKEDTKLLYVGDSAILESYFLQRFKCCSTSLSNLDLIQDSNFDYIIVDGEFDCIDDKESSLYSLLNKLDLNGQLILLTNNKLALRYFAGVKEFESDEFFGNLKKHTNLYSKNQWDVLFSKLNVNAQYYYPYPDYFLTTQVLSDEWLTGNINLEYEDCHEFRYRFFNENIALQSLVESGDFATFSNSFMIILSNHKSNFIYSKISSERKDEFKICTNILKDQDAYRVEKVALHPSGISHFERIYKFYKTAKHNELFHYCPVHLENNKLIFDFIKGENLESIVNGYVKHDQLDKIFETMDLLYKINTYEDLVDFKINQEFIDVFGKQDESLLSNQKCIRFCDIDVILENVILTNDDSYSILDYEWVFDCTVPISFIMYRAILHSIALSKLKKAEIDQIYLRYGITKELKEVYLAMEEHFQAYVSDLKIRDYYSSLPRQVIDLRKEIDRHYVDIIIGDDKEAVFNSGQIHYEKEVGCSDFKIEFGKKAIFKLNEIKVNGNIVSNFKTNATFVIHDDYYFIDVPQIDVQNKEAGLFEFDFYMYYYGEDCIGNIINLIDANHSLNEELNRLKSSKLYRFMKK
ncbi:hypothetical protein [Holdemanella biformis]|uniref:hypothetical protein n=1 Tax=Holdemanella biformis TaxID=1735 RepID=UPI002943C573|nr:hypothetical protein [Holdemanella biformis]